MMIKVNVVEDNQFLLDDIIYSLNTRGFDCGGAVNAKSFDCLMLSKQPDIVILDITLPDESGLSIARRLRDSHKTKNIGIVFLTARGSLNDRIEGLELADSYQVKPIDYGELAAVITSVYRRLPTNGSFLENLVWQLHEKTLELHSPLGEILGVSYREYIVLQELCQSTTGPVSAKQIIEAWNENWLTYEKNRLELLLSRLRSKIKGLSNDKANPIRSIRNQGYNLMIVIEIKS